MIRMPGASATSAMENSTKKYSKSQQAQGAYYIGIRYMLYVEKAHAIWAKGSHSMCSFIIIANSRSD